MEIWKEVFANQKHNSEIAASGVQDFAVDDVDFKNKVKYGSMNTLVLTNLSNNAIRLTLDGIVFGELGAGGMLVIEAKDGIFFNLIRITNLSSTDVVPAGTISLRWGRSEPLKNG